MTLNWIRPVLSVEEIMEVMKIKGNEIGEVMFGWERKMQAEAIMKAIEAKRRTNV